MVPQGYKQTEVGIIPENWDIKNISQLGEVVTGSTPSRDILEYWNGYFNWISAIDFASKYIDKTHETLTDLGKKQCRILPEGCVLVTCIASIGLNAITKTTCATNQQINAIICNKDVHNEYLYYQICNQKQALLLLAGQTAVPIISKRQFQHFSIAIPPIEEQRRIAEVLSDVDELIAALDKKIAKKKLIKQAAMQQLLTGKERLQGFTDEWSNRTFQQIFQHISTHGYHIDASEYTSVGKTPIIDQGKDLIIGYTNKKSFECPHKGVIVFGDHTRIFKYVDFNFCVGADGTQVLMCNDGFDTKYIYYICSSAEIPNTGYNRHFKFLKEYDFFISPNIEEQQAIATILSDMDAEISDLERKRDKYKFLKNGMMQKLLTGQIHLTKPMAPIIPLQTHVIAGHIVNSLYNSRGWGRTKLQKTIHLVAYHCQLDLGNEFIRNTAGPDDQRMMNYIDQKLKQYRHVRIDIKRENGKHRYIYTPTAMIDEVEQVYEQYPQPLRANINSLLDKIKTMDLSRAEIVSTLYAVWNNRIIRREPITDDLLLTDFYNWSTHKSDFSRDLVLRGLNYMRNVGIVPIGWGKYINNKKEDIYAKTQTKFNSK